MPEAEYLTKDQAAARLQLSVRRFMELVETGKLKGERGWNAVTRRQAVMVRASEIERYLREEEARRIAQQAVPAPAVQKAVDRAKRIAGIAQAMIAPPTPAPRPWLTLDESAEYSGLPAATLRELVAAGRLPALDVGVRPGGRYRVRRVDLDALEGVVLASASK